MAKAWIEWGKQQGYVAEMIIATISRALTEQNHRITSAATPDYNCIAWSAGDVEHWWQPGAHWPIVTSDDDYGIGVLEQAFLSLGFEECQRQHARSRATRRSLSTGRLCFTPTRDGNCRTRSGRASSALLKTSNMILLTM